MALIKFSQIPAQLPYPQHLRATLSTLHSEVVSFVVENFQSSFEEKSKIVSLLNTISHYIVTGDSLPDDWEQSKPFENLQPVDQSTCKDVLKSKGLFVTVKSIDWDIESNYTEPVTASTLPEKVFPTSKPEPVKPKQSVHKDAPPTPKEHLFIRPPGVPQFDATKPWFQQTQDTNVYTIYPSLPEIPVNQSQISITTDIDKMTAADLTKLFPNCVIRTRAAIMYEEYESLTLDPDVGIILPIMGFSPKQIKDNIIKYPHLFKLTREVDGQIQSFYSNFEIKGELHSTLDVWATLPDSKKMPRHTDYIKEYVVRRYLLERDIKNIDHKFPLFGDLQPFLTLFMPASDYLRLGYKEPVELARQCVNARVEYKRSRSPILRRVAHE